MELVGIKALLEYIEITRPLVGGVLLFLVTVAVTLDGRQLLGSLRGSCFSQRMLMDSERKLVAENCETGL